jgi:SSS family solute:Na+ symporter
LGLALLCLTYFLGEVLMPPYVQRLLIAKSPRAAARGTILAGIFSIPFAAVTGLIGLITLAMEPAVSSNLALPHLVVTVLPTVLKGLVISGIIAVVMSSADSFLNSASIAFVNDIVKPLGGAGLSTRVNLALARIVTLVIGLLSIYFALTVDTILEIIFIAYTYWAPIIVVPMVATLMGHPRGKLNFVAGAAAGFVTALLWNEVLDKPLGIEGLVMGTLANVLLFYLIPAKPAAQRQAA